MNKHAIRHFSVVIVFLAVAIVFFSKTNISFVHFILFFFCGVTVGANLVIGVKSMKKKNQET